MIYMQKSLDIKNIHSLVDEEIKGKSKTNNPTNEQIKKYEKHGSELTDREKFASAHEGTIVPLTMNHVRIM